VSSNSYSARLTPDPWLQIFVLTSGRVLYAIGIVLILLLPIHPVIRGFACLIWVIAAYWEISRFENNFRQCVEIRIYSSGDLEIADDNADWAPATLLAGSLVLRQLGWLRIRSVKGQTISQPLRGDARESQDWRRLQVIWQHVGAARRSC